MSINKTYIYDQANRISSFIKEKYNDNPEFLWDDDNNSVFRNFRYVSTEQNA